MKHALLLAALLAPGARAASRAPYFVDASSTSAVVCWRDEKGLDSCRNLTGLPPGEEFSYSAAGGSWTARALPADGQELRFAAFADIGAGGRPQRRVAAALERWSPALVIIAGDLVYPAGKDKHYDANYFLPYKALLPRVPFFPALGNHDYGHTKKLEKGERRYREGYRRVHRRPKYYSFDAGPVHFVSLDDNKDGLGLQAGESVLSGSPQHAWLEKDLAASRAPWKVVFLHVPLYTARDYGDQETLRKALEPVFLRHGVDLVVQGHNHFYERTAPIKGIVYLTAGSGGGRLYDTGGKREWSEALFSGHGFVGFKATRSELSIEMIDDKGRPRDSAVLKKDEKL